jgi:hypothetical protein
MNYNEYGVSEQTCIINRIKSNNETVELLEAIEKAMDKIHYDSIANVLYKDHEGNYFPADSDTRDTDFYNDICEWITKNCVYLTKDSMEQYTRLRK